MVVVGLEVVVFESGAQTAVVLRCGVRDESRTTKGSREPEPRLRPAEWPPRRKTDTASNSLHIIAVYARRLVVTQSLVCSSNLTPLHVHRWLGTKPVASTVKLTELGPAKTTGDGRGRWQTRCLLW